MRHQHPGQAAAADVVAQRAGPGAPAQQLPVAVKVVRGLHREVDGEQQAHIGEPGDAAQRAAADRAIDIEGDGAMLEFLGAVP